MTRRIEVFADITCPFTHVGLKRVAEQLETLDRGVDLVVRAWPLEWVNDAPMQAGPIAEKIAAFEEQLGVDDFRGFSIDAWPTTTIPALNLAAAGSAVDARTGLAVSLALRSALFEEGRDISDPDVLEEIAAAHGLSGPGIEADPRVIADYADGRRRGVRGSPDFWVDEEEFFCPTLQLTRDEDGGLLTDFDPGGLERFIDAATREAPGDMRASGSKDPGRNSLES